MARIILIFFILIPVFLFGQLPPEKMSAPEYVGKFKEAAIREMEEGGVPASITLAQGLLESGNGNSPLARNANNHFGIKCHVGWEGETYIQDDDEANECFRKYKTVFDSYRDHSNFLRNRQRYAFLFELDPTDYKGWAKGLKKAGYATDPSYADRLIKLIEQYELHKIDEIAAISLRNKTIVVKKKKHDTKPLKENKNRSNWNLDLTVSVGDRDVKFNNNVKYIVAKQGDTYEKIAKDLEMFEWQLRKYNELTKDGGIVPGQVLYIQPKRSRAEKEFHKLESGETMIEVSQKYAVKLKALYRKNNIQFGAAVAPGTLLYLKKRKPPVVNP